MLTPTYKRKQMEYVCMARNSSTINMLFVGYRRAGIVFVSKQFKAEQWEWFLYNHSTDRTELLNDHCK